MKTIRLMTFESPVEANLVKGRLENEGIPCFVTNEHFSNLMPHYNRIMDSGVQLMIREIDYQKAVELLELNVEKELVCPQCHSTSIKMSLGKNWFKKLVLISVSLFSGVPFNNINVNYLCKNCQTEFKNI
ncbi:DUF2007 domain-containing protein [Carboxylicivirga sediminis]|uniref:DUF2007 domain-containing protein n=1 Tax=Carboxylicivirga sediminis TaxID=2006564 RepID=A0A941ITB2_9BACT|nr:DUF2007 domain-containing protein [Carboxylicivirga sediminis]MBR8534211.1 DUF2007 domain-containing protein [Carboxylicivirga sediminis]